MINTLPCIVKYCNASFATVMILYNEYKNIMSMILYDEYFPINFKTACDQTNVEMGSERRNIEKGSFNLWLCILPCIMCTFLPRFFREK